MIAGAISAMKIAGKMKTPVGRTIFTGAFVACSSAAIRRRCRDSDACVRRTLPSGVPSCSDWISDVVTDVSSGMSTRSDIRRSALARLSPIAELAQDELELLGQRAVLVLAELAERTVEAEAGLDADREDVECVGKLAAHLLAARAGPHRDDPVEHEVPDRTERDGEDDGLRRATGEDADQPAQDDAGRCQDDLGRMNSVGENVRARPEATSRRPIRSSLARGSKRSAILARPCAVPGRQPLVERVYPLFAAGQRVGACAAQRGLAVTPGRRQRLADERKRTGETEERENENHVAITP